MTAETARLLQKAGQLANAGRWRDAERIWLRIIEIEPGHSKALFSLGLSALRTADLDKAHRYVRAAREQAPEDLAVLMSLSTVCCRLGDSEGEREAFEAALAVDAYFLPGLLARASWQERFASSAEAAATYSNALKISPPPSEWPAALRRQLEHARAFVDSWSGALDDHLARCLHPLQATFNAEQKGRWAEAASILAGRSKPFPSESNKMHVPRLPAIPFFDRAEFPSLEWLEQRTGVIRDELLRVLELDSDEFRPYVAYRPGDPVNQWQDLNHSPRWSAFHLWRNGAPTEKNLERCPETAKALEEAGMVIIDGLCPNAMFSALAPRTHIPPHNGETNARLVAHLPLIVPEDCRFRVGFEVRQWKVGETLVFDDTIEHEAFNDSDALRVVLIFDLWNPFLTKAEREAVKALATASREFKRSAKKVASSD